jgi:plastocyanin
MIAFMSRRVAILCLLVSFGCGGPEPADKSAASVPPASGAGSAAAGNAVVTGRAGPRSVITLSSVATPEPPLPPGPVVMDQLGKQFVPELLVARVGQPVEFRNSEEMEHNVIVDKVRTGAAVFNASPPPFQRYTHVFTEPGLYSVSCDIHPGMRAMVVAAATPHVVVADQSGTFTFADIPPGAYTLTVLGDGRDVTQRVDVTAPRTALTLTAW